jgi:hypothetical protein
MTRFKKGEITKKVYAVIMHDLECLDLRANDESNQYHFTLLKNNLKDIFGIK